LHSRSQAFASKHAVKARCGGSGVLLGEQVAEASFRTEFSSSRLHRRSS
jgi:hypothetical protein